MIENFLYIIAKILIIIGAEILRSRTEFDKLIALDNKLEALNQKKLLKEQGQ
jgi:hypothetical protein